MGHIQKKLIETKYGPAVKSSTRKIISMRDPSICGKVILSYDEPVQMITPDKVQIKLLNSLVREMMNQVKVSNTGIPRSERMWNGAVDECVQIVKNRIKKLKGGK